MTGRRGALAALAIALVAFAPFAVNAILFLRLPPMGVPDEELGWTHDGSFPEIAVVEAEGTTAWVVFPPVMTVCHVELATGKALRCARGLEKPRFESSFRTVHAAAAGRFLAVAPRSSEDLRSIAAMIVRDDGISRFDVTPPWPPTEKLALIGALATDGGFEIDMARDVPGRLVVGRLLVGANGGAQPWQVNDVEAPLGFGPAAFFSPGPPLRILASATGDSDQPMVDETGQIQRFLNIRCSQTPCIQRAATAQYEQNYERLSMWIDAKGRLVDMRSIAPVLWEDGVDDVFRVEWLHADGTSEPHFVRGAYVDDRDYDVRQLTAAVGEKDVTFTIRARAAEELLEIHGDGGVRTLARAETDDHGWSVIPHAHGALLLDYGRIVVLDETLHRVDHGSRLRSALDEIVLRFPIHPLRMIGHLICLLSFAPLAAWAMLRLRRPDSTRRLLLGAIAYALFAALVLVANRHVLFPR